MALGGVTGVNPGDSGETQYERHVGVTSLSLADGPAKARMGVCKSGAEENLRLSSCLGI